MNLGDRMKAYERAGQVARLTKNLPVVVRVDGKKFSSWTRGLRKPNDVDLEWVMDIVTKGLVAETGAVIGYTQSDDISLVLYADDPKSQIYFDGKLSKIISVVASMTTALFNRHRMKCEKLRDKPDALFDCRAFCVPNKEEAVNALIWRELDATKNSLMSLARAHYSHRALLGKNRSEQHQMLMDAGVNWNDQPDRFKRGAYFGRRTYTVSPPDPGYEGPEIERSRVVDLRLPPITSVVNRVDVVFDAKEPELAPSPSVGEVSGSVLLETLQTATKHSRPIELLEVKFIEVEGGREATRFVAHDHNENQTFICDYLPYSGDTVLPKKPAVLRSKNITVHEWVTP